jgi:hypothetical protein
MLCSWYIKVCSIIIFWNVSVLCFYFKTHLRSFLFSYLILFSLFLTIRLMLFQLAIFCLFYLKMSRQKICSMFNYEFVALSAFMFWVTQICIHMTIMNIMYMIFVLIFKVVGE